MEWADRVRRMTVRTNADTPADARAARSFGAEGIGLCRTEHMFFEGERIHVMREMILAADEAGRRAALDKLLADAAARFHGSFSTSCTDCRSPSACSIRRCTNSCRRPTRKSPMLPPPWAWTQRQLRQRVDALHEFNPMLGHRGCRLAISYPEIVEMQARAIFEAAVEAAHETGAPVVPEIMVPLVGLQIGARLRQGAHRRHCREVMAEAGIEDRLSGRHDDRAAACGATRPCHRRSRRVLLLRHQRPDADDLRHLARRRSAFIPTYQRKGIIEHDPFISLDFDGVGELIRIATERGRRTRNDMKLGICGEHGGDPASIHFCEETGLDYVSCSPFRVPIARLAAAQAAIKQRLLL
jgi:pyruvate,orthophosphate dikinase